MSAVHGVGLHVPPPATQVFRATSDWLQRVPACEPPTQTPLKADGVEPLAWPQKPQKTLWPAAKFAAVLVWEPVERLKGMGRLPMKGAGGGQSWLVGCETPLSVVPGVQGRPLLGPASQQSVAPLQPPPPRMQRGQGALLS